MSWKPEVQTDNSGKWYGNGLRFATEAEAAAWAADLSTRWLLVREHRAADAGADPVNCRIVDGRVYHGPEVSEGEASGDAVSSSASE